MSRAAMLLRIAAEAEIARVEGDLTRYASLLDAIDPVEARRLAAELDEHATGPADGIRWRDRTPSERAAIRSRTPW